MYYNNCNYFYKKVKQIVFFIKNELQILLVIAATY